MANTLKQSGAQSATFVVPPIPDPEGDISGTLTIADWNTLPSGKLKTLLTTAYEAVGPVIAEEVFFNAAADAGLVTNLFPISLAGVFSPQWTFDGDGYPVLGDVAGNVATFYARIQTSYSASE